MAKREVLGDESSHCSHGGVTNRHRLGYSWLELGFAEHLRRGFGVARAEA